MSVESARPARGYSWTPFAPGHELSMKHGAFSSRRLAPRAQELVTQALAGAVIEGSTTWYLTEPSFGPAIWAWARSEAAVELLEAWLADHGGPIDDEGQIQPAAHHLERVARRAERLRSRLGLDPLSRGQLARDLATVKQSGDLARLKAIGAGLIGDEQAAEDSSDTDDDAPEENDHG
jgi:hypothetical protein